MYFDLGLVDELDIHHDTLKRYCRGNIIWVSSNYLQGIFKLTSENLQLYRQAIIYVSSRYRQAIVKVSSSYCQDIVKVSSSYSQGIAKVLSSY